MFFAIFVPLLFLLVLSSLQDFMTFLPLAGCLPCCLCLCVCVCVCVFCVEILKFPFNFIFPYRCRVVVVVVSLIPFNSLGVCRFCVWQIDWHLMRGICFVMFYVSSPSDLVYSPRTFLGIREGMDAYEWHFKSIPGIPLVPFGKIKPKENIPFVYSRSQ